MKKPKKNLFRWILGIVILITLIGGALKIRSTRIHQSDHIENAGMPPWAVRVGAVREKSLATAFPVLATVLTSEEQTISGQLQGEIREMGPREGERVKKGDLLARIDTREIDDQILAEQAKLAAAEADLANKQNEYAREKELLDAGGSTPSKVEGWQTAVLAARQTVESLNRIIGSMKVRRGFAEVKAPSDGMIAARLAEPGDVCTLSHPLFRITVARGARVRVKLPQQVIEELHPGASLVLTHGKKEMTVSLNRLFPSLDALALGAAEADLPAPPFGLASGARVSGRVVLAERKKALVIPHEAVLSPASDPAKGTVFKVAPEKGTPGEDAAGNRRTSIIKTVPVVIDLDAAAGVAVIGDLKEGDFIVVAHDTVLLKLHDGDAVNAINPEK